MPPPTLNSEEPVNRTSIRKGAQGNGSLLIVLGDVVLAGAGFSCGFFFPGPGVGDVCVGPGDDKRQDEDSHDEGSNACGCACACGCGAHGCASVVMGGVIRDFVRAHHGR